MSIRLVIVDDQGMVRAGFARCSPTSPTSRSSARPATARRRSRSSPGCVPDVTLMDIRMPVLDGIAATRQLVAAAVPTKVLVLTTFDLDEYVFEALRAGASGFLLKDAPGRGACGGDPGRGRGGVAAGPRRDQAGDRRLRTTPRATHAHTGAAAGLPDAA